MRQLHFIGPRRAEWVEAPEPQLTTNVGAIVEPIAVSSCDMDAVALSGRIRFRSGTPLGHEGVGVVVEVADGVTTCSPGDTVIIPWQISCGTCPRCRRGQDTFCTTVPPGSCYGWGPHVQRWGGFLADRFEVPYADHMLVPLPEGMDPVHASGIGDNLVDAWRTVGPPLVDTGGGRVLVVGGVVPDGGSIGIYAVAFARGLEADDVVFVSPDAHLRDLARECGARVVAAAGVDGDLGSFDVTVDASGTADGLALALRSTGPGGVCTCTAGAVHRGQPVPVPVYEMYMNVVTFRTGWVHTRALLEAPLALIANGLFDPTVPATIYGFEDVVDALAQPFTKLIFTRQSR
ncbi:MAG: alcohol dehydrogenase catalytic domain-containing protein [Acidimicrobiaceae bacterium]|nr:alcohol dehydrogenase catalytic domain-containing protein [Acidimicrobiaceae bacterium]